MSRRCDSSTIAYTTYWSVSLLRRRLDKPASPLLITEVVVTAALTSSTVSRTACPNSKDRRARVALSFQGSDLKTKFSERFVVGCSPVACKDNSQEGVCSCCEGNLQTIFDKKRTEQACTYHKAPPPSNVSISGVLCSRLLGFIYLLKPSWAKNIAKAQVVSTPGSLRRVWDHPGSGQRPP